MTSLKEAFSVRSFEVDAFNDLAVPALWGYLQEAAGLSADALGFGVKEVLGAGFTWVLARQRLEISRAARFGETVEVETWPNGIERLAAHREFVVRERGQVIAQATSVWFLLDLKSRCPVDPGTALHAAFPRERGPDVIALPGAKIPAPEQPELERPFTIRFADIDLNWHVNNVSYVQWLLEAVPKEVWHEKRPAVVDAQYVAECDWGGRVLTRARAAGPDQYLHAVVHETDGKEIARGMTGWVAR
ncbi:MAG TPA: acyl-ACP thioesterase domain-containing protein [Anaeromyxobacteraceae bacterium]|nr:acyl-ACP thioesterase domain-containing protein [Anaeromyxobacteraceae bacterium]